MKTDLTFLNAQMPVGLARQVRIVAGFSDTTRSEIVRRALREYIARWNQSREVNENEV